jgi:hypothetical protein
MNLRTLFRKSNQGRRVFLLWDYGMVSESKLILSENGTILIYNHDGTYWVGNPDGTITEQQSEVPSQYRGSFPKKWFK